MKPKQQGRAALPKPLTKLPRALPKGWWRAPPPYHSSILALILVGHPIHALTVVATVPRKGATTRLFARARALAKSAQTREDEEVDGDLELSPTRHMVEMIPIHVIEEVLVIWYFGSALDNPDVSAMRGPTPMTKLLFDHPNCRVLNMMSCQLETMLHLATQRMAAVHKKHHHACS